MSKCSMLVYCLVLEEGEWEEKSIETENESTTSSRKDSHFNGCLFCYPGAVNSNNVPRIFL